MLYSVLSGPHEDGLKQRHHRLMIVWAHPHFAGRPIISQALTCKGDSDPAFLIARETISGKRWFGSQNQSSLYESEVGAPTATLLAREARANHGLLYSSATSYSLIQTKCNCGDCYMELGEFEAALACVLEAGRIANAAKKSWLQTNTAARAARIQLRQGEFHLAIKPIKEIIESARRSEASSTFFMACADLGTAYTFLAQPMDAIPLLENAAASDRTGERYWAMIPALSALGQSLGMIGQIERARECVGRSLELARDSGFRGLEAWAMYRRAAVLSYAVKVDFDAARESYLEALALATSLCMRPLAAHCRMGLAEIYRRMHLNEKGDEQTRVAATDFDNMKMRFFRQRIEKLSSKTPASLMSSSDSGSR